MKLAADFLSDAPLQRVMSMLSASGHRALIVGGAVRNAALGYAVDDVDISTDAHPKRVIELARDAGLKAVPTGIDHGTVTIVADGTGFEVTTFRRDLETDGRWAVVSFSDRIEDDAARRDFTMNALYLTADGQLLDPVNGWNDLQNRELRFVGDPATRIREDYLRILRFFRFLAWYAESSAPGITGLVAAERAGLSGVSAERIGAEIRKLLSAPDPSASVALMEETGVLTQILPGAKSGTLTALVLQERHENTAPDWQRRLAALGAEDPAGVLRLSRQEATYLSTVNASAQMSLDEIAFHHGFELARDIALIRLAKDVEVAQDWQQRIDRAANATLPVTAADLMPALSGPQIGRGLKAAEAHWIESGFAATRPALIETALLAGKDDS
ncbi:CCA tRNA nucleotidyltransferase [Paracoccus aerodenitrificans]|uniref:CCA tRNA nucleotidyltransferase n=1 Tax=Paracoccus aerodenitrificans TaxID=3017781 RepID=UPI0022F07A78|nr:CCA tRNA nucleotidyltransferase [Paracoccus aerodenitrificans]WBU63947.1 CCA tRNA nucleotidyltransferase [Paracoccus aerodenitrificans]